MAEKVPVLKHHYVQILEFYSGITDLQEAEEAVRTEMFPETRNLIAADKQPAYPNMDEGSMAREYAKMIVSVNTDNAVVLPEWGSDGFKNMDGACGPCGNQVVSANDPNRKMCNLWRRAAKLRKKQSLF